MRFGDFNVNWRNGNLNPYVIFWVDPNRRLATKSDDSNSTKPVWNERFVVPLPSTPFAAVLTLEIFHAKPSDTPKPLVGTLRVPLGDLPDPENSDRIRTFDVRRPSGRLNGKIRLKIALRERALPDYQNTQKPPFYYASPPPPSYGRLPSSPSPYGSYSSLPNPPPAPAASPLSAARQAPPPYHSVSQSDPYSLYYQGGCYSQAAPSSSPRPSIDRQFSYASVSGGPSAPMDYAHYDQKPRNGKMGSGLGLAFGTNTGGVAGLAIDEGLRYEDGKIGERVETDMGVKKPDEYVYYRRVDY
ncbi:C2 calcium-dependent membrane targeting [Cynara cardunculus var. scolymus]|uniref:C2 calcium-dependent membrane targeting n=1 Tax=Cynara cardunculus var. scolymus TaxID=59895 RepID=A0A124SG06_CYNCS|nr:C2 calcium-dependent membrane targeting [Cynara cardunculus var. scolymus]